MQRHRMALAYRFDISFLATPATEECVNLNRLIQRAELLDFACRKEAFSNVLTSKLGADLLDIHTQFAISAEGKQGEASGMRHVEANPLLLKLVLKLWL